MCSGGRADSSGSGSASEYCGGGLSGPACEPSAYSGAAWRSGRASRGAIVSGSTVSRDEQYEKARLLTRISPSFKADNQKAPPWEAIIETFDMPELDQTWRFTV